MKTIFIFISVYIWCFYLFGAQEQSNKQTIGVIDFYSTDSSFTAMECRVITDRFRDLIIQTSKYTIFERSQIDEILEEQGFQLSGCISIECNMEVGKLLGTDYIVSANINKGENLELNGIIINVVDASVIDATLILDNKLSIGELIKKNTIKNFVNLVGKKINSIEKLQK